MDVLDEMIGWDRLVASREEIDALDDLATEDPLSLAASRYAQLRRFGRAFLEAFEFDAPSAGRSQHAAVDLLRELVRSGRRKLPVIVPILFARRQWKALVADNAKTARRTYETAVVAPARPASRRWCAPASPPPSAARRRPRPRRGCRCGGLGRWPTSSPARCEAAAGARSRASQSTAAAAPPSGPPRQWRARACARCAGKSEPA